MRPDDLLIWTKADLGPLASDAGHAVSAITGTGLQSLHNVLAERLALDLSGADFPAVTRERHHRRLSEALAAVTTGQARLVDAPELAADDLRRAAAALSRVTGSIGVEDVLGEVFSTFCIGK
jgi:tRNA modification GTPase